LGVTLKNPLILGACNLSNSLEKLKEAGQAGASAIEAVSTFYHNGVGHAAEMLKELEEWMDRKEYDSIEAFRGKLSSNSINDPFIYKRAQYIDMLPQSEEHFNAVI